MCAFSTTAGGELVFVGAATAAGAPELLGRAVAGGGLAAVRFARALGRLARHTPRRVEPCDLAAYDQTTSSAGSAATLFNHQLPIFAIEDPHSRTTMDAKAVYGADSL